MMKFKDYDHTKICNKIKEWRINRGITVESIANETSYTRANIYNFEKGTNNNMDLLIWYMIHGFNVRRYLDGEEE